MITLKLIESLRTPYASRLPTPSEAAKLTQDLRPLGDFWLRPDVLAAAAEHIRVQYGCDAVSQATPEPRRSRKSRGGCWVLLASSDPGHPLLRDAFVLPLEWRRGGQHSQGLPRGLADEAERILTAVGIKGLSLHLQAELEATGGSLEKIAFGYESAWAALAAGAIIFDQGGENFGDVLVSAAWQAEEGSPTGGGSQGHLAFVTGIAAKIEAAAAHDTRLLFLPKANEAEARQVVSRDEQAFNAIDVRFLESTTGKPRTALREVLGELESPPTRRDGWEFEDRERYHLSLPGERAEQYYVEELVDDVIERVHVDHRLQYRSIERLVMVASPSRGGAYLLAKVLDPAEILLLHDDRLPEADLSQLVAGLRDLQRSDGMPRVVTAVQCPAGDAFAADVKRAVVEFTQARGAARIFIDVTLGHRDFLFALLAAVPPGAIVGYVMSDKDRNRPKAGSTQLKIVDWWPAMRAEP